MVEMPHVPQVGSFLWAQPEDSQTPEGLDPTYHAYKVVSLVYHVGLPPKEGPPDGLRPLLGWEMMLEDLGPRGEFVFPTDIEPFIPKWLGGA